MADLGDRYFSSLLRAQQASHFERRQLFGFAWHVQPSPNLSTPFLPTQEIGMVWNQGGTSWDELGRLLPTKKAPCGAFSFLLLAEWTGVEPATPGVTDRAALHRAHASHQALAARPRC